MSKSFEAKFCILNMNIEYNFYSLCTITTDKGKFQSDSLSNWETIGKHLLIIEIENRGAEMLSMIKKHSQDGHFTD